MYHWLDWFATKTIFGTTNFVWWDWYRCFLILDQEFVNYWPRRGSTCEKCDHTQNTKVFYFVTKIYSIILSYILILTINPNLKNY